MKKIMIKTDYIKLGQFLKIIGLIQSGAQAKLFLEENNVIINSLADSRRGRKLYKNDVVKIKNSEFLIISENDTN